MRKAMNPHYSYYYLLYFCQGNTLLKIIISSSLHTRLTLKKNCISPLLRLGQQAAPWASQLLHGPASCSLGRISAPWAGQLLHCSQSINDYLTVYTIAIIKKAKDLPGEKKEKVPSHSLFFIIETDWQPVSTLHAH